MDTYARLRASLLKKSIEQALVWFYTGKDDGNSTPWSRRPSRLLFVEEQIRRAAEAFYGAAEIRDGVAPDALTERFREERNGARERFVEAMMEELRNALNRGDAPRVALDASGKLLEKYARSFSGLVGEYDRIFSAYRELSRYERQGYAWCRYQSARGKTTCAECSARDGQVYSTLEVALEGKAPPLHPNCACQREK